MLEIVFSYMFPYFFVATNALFICMILLFNFVPCLPDPLYNLIVAVVILIGANVVLTKEALA